MMPKKSSIDHKSKVVSYKDKNTLYDGSSYSGEWKNGERHGKGECQYSNGDAFYGTYRYDQRYFGTYKYSFVIPAVYQGTWYQNKKEGEGQFTYGNGNIYYGQFDKDYRHGLGKMSLKNGTTYFGEYH